MRIMVNRPEDIRVKIPALVHFTRLGYDYMSIKNKNIGIDYDPDTNIFYTQFRDAVNKINGTDLSMEAVKKIIEEIKIKLDNKDLGKAFFTILKDGIDGNKLLDFNSIDNNSFIVVTELPYANGEDSFRPDIVVLINGMPLCFVEVKRINNKEGIIAERDRMTKRFSNDIYRRYANITQFTVFSNNNEYDDNDIEPIQGAFYAASNYGKMFFSKFREQRKEELIKDIVPIDEDVELNILKDTNFVAIKGTPEYKSSLDVDTPTHRIITSLFSKDRLMFLLQYGICYRVTEDKLGKLHIEKHIMRYPQLFATFAIQNKLDEGIKKGVIWHTQGSGKTALAYSNVYYLRDYYQKRNTIAKFYFIVDRLALATQARDEFIARGLDVELVDSKEDFKKNIASIGETKQNGKTIISVVNIQKFSAESITRPADYNVNIQRIYFLDEAHRSYNPKGSFLANLMASDRNAVMIALTGTPLIGDGYNTKDIFGNYIHKYYYNQSIADGYTLRLIREEIETTYVVKMRAILDELGIEKGSIDIKEFYAKPKFVAEMVKYIITDFKKSRIIMDNSIGTMIVCDSSQQAREISKQLDNHTEYVHALVLYDEGSDQDRKDIQKNFKNGEIDILVVYNMLLTGFDAPRLKKMYLGRVIKSHNLLQTLTRVNRPYKGFHYGYVVDFADIKEEFDKTNKAYFDELESEIGSEVKNYSDMFKTPEEVKSELEHINSQLFLYNTNNVVEFTKQISAVDDRKSLMELRDALDNYKVLHNLIRGLGYEELYEQFTIDKAVKLLNEVNNRISLINFKKSLQSKDESASLLNLALDQLEFHFKKIKEEELVIADKFQATMEKTRHAVVDLCFDPKDPEYISLFEELKRIFKKKDIEELTADEMNEAMNELDALRKKAELRNHKDELLASKYGGDNKFMRTHKRIMENKSFEADNITTFEVLSEIKAETDEMLTHNERVISNEPYFYAALRPLIMKAYKKKKKHINSKQLDYINGFISKEYIIERNWFS